MIEVHYFAAARQAAGVASEACDASGTLADLIAQLGAQHSGATEAGMPFAQVLERCTFLVDGAAAQPAAPLAGAARVDVLPPFAGG
ncbi:MoaD/ThiS family protein [uncultured Corynebacterium sp.]|uniref:MoaD/ThiS family protein n=1 Tax=uncultured Corynebacterium sp. TaxID=159447 RepID=UPI0025D106E3|nr:MoaD/ThiS family protein [uncultured Corynebacterium sp.]